MTVSLERHEPAAVPLRPLILKKPKDDLWPYTYEPYKVDKTWMCLWKDTNHDAAFFQNPTFLNDLRLTSNLISILGGTELMYMHEVMIVV